jgi:hypothetical protein
MKRMDASLWNGSWQTLKEWLDDDLVKQVKRCTRVGGTVGSIHENMYRHGQEELAERFKNQLEERCYDKVKESSSRVIPPERDSFTIHFPDGGFVKVRLIGSKDDIDLFKAEHDLR